ncbi:5-(carboxyamino)imidazole ribonucleotide synthase [Spiroplasma litorale]|uniref:5-(Carboxyamino)imidazole ribonucleotide synthase n=1 Tax=Spiroplasma litorale TaxID=216942 RepID=A0A0K1W2M4_9MOLU|nr:ATP-grasp domain-containing protein [Spiroplasma litorale]AKX34580.1 5-(carboxyamino)imidazole ribonucleotide synthase [Spiroplasma litorale]
MKVGIIGGGQLAKMLVESDNSNEYFILEPNEINCCMDLNVNIINKNYDDKIAIDNLVTNTDVITYEFENIDSDALKKYFNLVKPSINFLEISKNRIQEKNFAKENGLLTTKFFLVENKKDIETLLNKNDITYPFILKTLSGGYDGKGQYKINNYNEIESVNFISNKYILEEFCEFDYETSLVVTRSNSNQIYFFPNAINKHENGILITSKVTNKKVTVDKKTIKIIKKVLVDLNLVGTVAFEFFVKDNKFYFNEMAPRVHNTGHYTLDGCNVSQFKNHILAITNKKIIKPKLKYKTIMINLLGENIKTNFDCNWVKKYDYHKKGIIKNRKMGHINIIAKNQKDLLDKYNQVKKILGGLND